MDELQRLTRVWNLLPAFRAVAESEHLPTAACRLNATPSALSHAVRSLEAELGQALFHRAGRRLQLSPAGHELLRALRESMSRLDRGLRASSNSHFLGPVRVSAPEPFASAFVLSAVERLIQAHPLLVPQLSALASSTACRWVMDRRVDLAIVDEPVPDPALRIRRLGSLAYGVYSGRTHPLHGRGRRSLDEVLRHAFVVPAANTVHPWPRELEREVAMVVSDMHLAIEACASGAFLALLADEVAQGPAGARLRRLSVDLPCEAPVFAVYRQDAADGPVGALLEELTTPFSTTAPARSEPRLTAFGHR